LQLITFENRAVESFDAIEKTGQDETESKESMESQSSLNSITQADPPLDTIMGGKCDIKLLQFEDSDFKDIVAFLKDGILTSDDKKARKTILEATNYSWSPSEGLHRMWILRSKNLDQLVPVAKLICVPRKLRTELMQSIHDRETIHTGQTKLLLTLRGTYYWPGQLADVQSWVESCTLCQSVKPKP
jgi:hypothetical protein